MFTANLRCSREAISLGGQGGWKNLIATIYMYVSVRSWQKLSLLLLLVVQWKLQKCTPFRIIDICPPMENKERLSTLALGFHLYLSRWDTLCDLMFASITLELEWVQISAASRVLQLFRNAMKKLIAGKPTKINMLYLFLYVIFM